MHLLLNKIVNRKAENESIEFIFMEWISFVQIPFFNANINEIPRILHRIQWQTFFKKMFNEIFPYFSSQFVLFLEFALSEYLSNIFGRAKQLNAATKWVKIYFRILIKTKLAPKQTSNDELTISQAHMSCLQLNRELKTYNCFLLNLMFTFFFLSFIVEVLYIVTMLFDFRSHN